MAQAARRPAHRDRRVVPAPGGRRTRTCTSARVPIFEGPPPAYDDFLDHIRARLHLVPRYRQKLAFPPLETGRPLWVDDPSFNLEYHVRHTALPRPGLRGAAAARSPRGSSPSGSTAPSRCGRCGWSRGSSDDRFALISKTHHAMSTASPASTSRPCSSTSPPVPADRRRTRTRPWQPAPRAERRRARRRAASRGLVARGRSSSRRGAVGAARPRRRARRRARGGRGRRRDRLGGAEPRAARRR